VKASAISMITRMTAQVNQNVSAHERFRRCNITNKSDTTCI